jgi:hypothetical protein
MTRRLEFREDVYYAGNCVCNVTRRWGIRVLTSCLLSHYVTTLDVHVEMKSLIKLLYDHDLYPIGSMQGNISIIVD